MSQDAAAAVHAPRIRVIRIGVGSWRLPLRSAAVCVAGLVVLAGVSALSIATGDFPIPVLDVVKVPFGGGDAGQQFIVNELRMPRLVVGILVGIALAISGALTQTFARNPLASPDVLGVTEGAAVGAVAVIVLAGTDGALATTVSGTAVPVAALIGAFAATTAIYLLAWRRGIDGQRLILIGIGLGAMLAGLTSWMLVQASVGRQGGDGLADRVAQRPRMGSGEAPCLGLPSARSGSFYPGPHPAGPSAG